MSQPIVIAVPAEMELSASPFPAEWVLDGTPRAYAKEIARSRDGAMRTIAWSCSTGRFRWEYSVDDTLHIIDGEVFVLDGTGAERRLGPGDAAFFSAGTSAVWRVTKDVRKVAVCHVPVPRPVGFALRAWGWLCRSLRTGSASAASDGGLIPAAPATSAR